MKLFARPQDDLKWVIEETPSHFEFELGLNAPYFPLEDELYFQALSAALTHFSKEIWPRFPASQAILYRGSADFSTHFLWTEGQQANFSQWKKQLPEGDETHLKRIFCLESFIAYFQMLAHKLPDEMPILLYLDPPSCGTLAEKLHLLSPERYEHFQVETSLHYTSATGVCFPPDSACTPEVLARIDRLFDQLPSFRAVYENMLTEQWDGLDLLYVLPEALTERGKRKLRGFEAAGGKVVYFRE